MGIPNQRVWIEYISSGTSSWSSSKTSSWTTFFRIIFSEKCRCLPWSLDLSWKKGVELKETQFPSLAKRNFKWRDARNLLFMSYINRNYWVFFRSCSSSRYLCDYKVKFAVFVGSILLKYQNRIIFHAKRQFCITMRSVKKSDFRTLSIISFFPASQTRWTMHILSFVLLKPSDQTIVTLELQFKITKMKHAWFPVTLSNSEVTHSSDRFNEKHS